MQNRSRREFLEDSMLAAAAAASASTFMVPLARAAESSSPNERLRVAVLGVAGRGQSHLDAFSKRKDTEVAIICDPDEQIGNQKLQKLKNATGTKAKFEKDLRRVMDDKSIDVVSIATPNHWHALASIWAIQAGKDVYVEKPVSHNVSEGRRIVQAARKYKKICQTGTQSRSSVSLAEAFAWLKDGKLGDIEVARGLCYKPRGSIGKVDGPQPIPNHIDYNLWTGPAPLVPLHRKRLHYDWHWIWDYGNGDLGNQGIHQMDICRWALGINRLCDSVLTIGGRWGYVDDGQTPNTEISYFGYGDQQLIFEVRGLVTPDYKGAKVGCVIHCSKGYMVVPSYSSATAFDLDGKEIKTWKQGGDHFGNFVDAVRSRKESDLNADIEQGHLSSALCHLGNISYRMGEEVSVDQAAERLKGKNEAEAFNRTKEYLSKYNHLKLNDIKVRVGPSLAFDPSTERFKDNKEADQHLTREYRSPFEVPEASRL